MIPYFDAFGGGVVYCNLCRKLYTCCMARKWTEHEKGKYTKELKQLYIRENKTIKEIAVLLGIAPQTVFKRLHICEIKTIPECKKNYRNIRTDLSIPKRFSKELAEFIGIMLGDGKLSHFQALVTLGNKELSYANYVCDLMEHLFLVRPKISTRTAGYHDVYISSVLLTGWLMAQGLVTNKVKYQVDAPEWIFSKKEYMKMCLRGFFDTDGSVYKLRYGMQLSFTNYSLPLLTSLQSMLLGLQYSPSRISSHKVYLTKKEDIERFFREIQPQNSKHCVRYRNICVGTQVVNEGRL